MRSLLILLALVAAPAAAQQVSSAPGAVLRSLDKISGLASDIEMTRGQAIRIGNLQVVMNDCRFPAGNPSGDAFAELEISQTGREGTVFSGWMIASAPALNALEHPRYDIWVIRCTTS